MDACFVLLKIENASDVLKGFGEPQLASFYRQYETRVNSFARSDDHVERIGRSKYALVLSNISDPMQIELAGAKLERTFQTPFDIDGHELKVTLHAAFVPFEGHLEKKMLLRNAERGLDDARSSNRMFVVRNLSTDSERPDISALWLRDVERGLACSEFEMYFQPKVDACDYTLRGAEALIRWQLSTGEVRNPGEFLAYVNGTSVMAPLTWFALKASIAHAVGWGDTLGVSVNVSPCLLLHSDLAEQVDDALTIFGFPPRLLTLEITEEAVIQDVSEAILMLNRLREMGCKISIDDFGTGYSSLSAFRELPVDELKIDRSFVSQMLHSPRDLDIVKAISGLAHSLSISLVAEGVEDIHTAAVLRDLGVQVLQGYLFSPPICADEFLEKVRDEFDVETVGRANIELPR